MDKDWFGDSWDDMLNAPSDMGELPGGFYAPSVSVPNPVDVGEGNQDIEARLGNCPSANADVLNEDPGSSDIRRASNDAWQFNWQTVDDLLEMLLAWGRC